MKRRFIPGSVGVVTPKWGRDPQLGNLLVAGGTSNGMGTRGVFVVTIKAGGRDPKMGVVTPVWEPYSRQRDHQW